MYDALLTGAKVLGTLWIALLAMLGWAVLGELRRERAARRHAAPAPNFGLCPGCEDLKPMRPGAVLCDGCWRVLPRLIQLRLMDGYLAERDGQGPRELIDAMTLARRYLGEHRNAAQPAPRA